MNLEVRLPIGQWVFIRFCKCLHWDENHIILNESVEEHHTDSFLHITSVNNDINDKHIWFILIYTEMLKSLRMNAFASLVSLKTMLLRILKTSSYAKDDLSVLCDMFSWSDVCCWLVWLSPCGPQVVATCSIASQTICVATSDDMALGWEHILKLTSDYIGLRLETHRNQPFITWN